MNRAMGMMVGTIRKVFIGLRFLHDLKSLSYSSAGRAGLTVNGRPLKSRQPARTSSGGRHQRHHRTESLQELEVVDEVTAMLQHGAIARAGVHLKDLLTLFLTQLLASGDQEILRDKTADSSDVVKLHCRWCCGECEFPPMGWSFWRCLFIQ